MTDFNFHLSQLPNFLQAEVHATAGATSGLPYSQIIARFRWAVGHLLSSKKAVYKPWIAVDSTFGTESAELDAIKMIVDSQPGNMAAFFVNHRQIIATESIRLLEELAGTLARSQMQIEESERQLARRRAEEAARAQAQQQAEAAARLLAQRQAEEAARLLAQQQAEEAARQLAQRQAEEAQLAQRQAEEEALLVIRPQVEHAAIRQIVERAVDDALKTAGVGKINATALTEFEDAASKLDTDVRVALADFTHATHLDASISATDAFSAMLYAFKQTGVDVQAAYEARMQ
jgi:hypothetical protein